MSIRTPRYTCNDWIQRKRTAAGDPIDERVCKYLKSMSNADCVSIGSLDRPIDVPRQEHHERSGRSESAPSVHRRRSQEEDSNNPFLHTASEQGDTSLIDDGDKLAHARGGCTETLKPSKDPDTPNVIVEPLTKRALQQLNKMNRSSLPEASPLLPSEASSALPESLELEETKGTISPYNPMYLVELNGRGIDFADETFDKLPSNLHDLKKALKEQRSDSGPNDKAARVFWEHLEIAHGKTFLYYILPKIVPLDALDADDATYTVPEQQWYRKIMIEPNAKPALTAVKPDQTIGWEKHIFAYPKAMDHLDAYACPVVEVPRLAFPLFTVEAEVDRGNLKVARLQNLHTGATMLSNLWRIRQFYNEEKEDEFFDKVHALSLQFTRESIELSCYWAAHNDEGHIEFHGTRIRTWTSYDVDQYKEAYRYTRNALEWVKNQAFDWICSALARLEGYLDTSPPTPPPTQSDITLARFLTSESYSANPSSKELDSKRTPEFLGAGDQEAEVEIGTSEDSSTASSSETGESEVGN